MPGYVGRERRRIMLTRRAFLGAAASGAALSLAGCGAGPGVSPEALAQTLRAPLAPGPDLLDCVRYATLAANGHNTQPWRFALGADEVAILPDMARRTPAADPDDHHLFASLGCAAENFLLAARARGLHGAARRGGGADQGIVLGLEPGAPEEDDLFAAIPRRQCTRSVYDGRAVPAEHLALMEEAAAVDGVRLIYLLDRPGIEAVAEQVVSANAAQMGDKAFVRELKEWLRFSDAQALETRDGLYAAASGNPTLPAWLGRLVFPFVVTVGGENDRYARQIGSSSGVAVFVSARDDHTHWIKAGQSFQRFALRATSLGIAHAFVNQPVEVAANREAFARWLGLGEGERPDFVVRFGYAPPLPMSLRRPVEEVLV